MGSVNKKVAYHPLGAATCLHKKVENLARIQHNTVLMHNVVNMMEISWINCGNAGH